MKWRELGEMNCPIARTLSIFGDRWTLLIIRNAFMKTRRFDDFQNQLGITRHLLTERINRLVENNIFEKVLYHEAPKRYEYRLTEKGLALYPILVTMSGWGNLWQNENKEFQELRYLHKSCGNVTKPALRCDCCGEEIDARQMSPVYLPTEQGEN
ncbi:helix-turn-helix domain-containing protein [Acinetobacter sp. NIPH 2699]|uniref:winged helix-turn-helix transcriptional regulator n=1 Tax=Acinetobacter sp. NIPH 2699 TaxID=2923433 RepID=UPI001F4A801D|nr:helix-turn-helix domain-containing protein [Acinetobacter sp. NIPH 2699]MCH7336382.1 helix-turn-helix transcriptional regulator [Acinetobacter sp. NIPH 2699]